MAAEVKAGLLVGEQSVRTHPRSSSWSRERTLVIVALTLVVLLGAFLRFYDLGAYGVGNAYYAATVQSMLTSGHNFFFVSFEPGGSVTVDKPPLGFWIQAGSAAIFGVNGFALALPQALAGVLSILVLYALVRRFFGVWPGLIAALVLATMPVAVSTERNNTIDGLLVLALLLAAWTFVLATERTSLGWLLLGAFLVGVAFNIKMLQAFLPLPAFYALYFFGARQRWWKRIAYLALATVLLLAVSLSWAVAVDLTPEDSRPYVGSSTDNSVLELITGHNGLRRIIGGGGGGQPRNTSPAGSTANAPSQPAQQPAGQPLSPRPGQPGAYPPPGGMGGTRPPTDPTSQQPGAPADRQPSGRNQEVGEAGILRLFTEPLVTEASWLLPVALLGIPLVLVVLGRPWPLKKEHLALILWAGWLLPELLYFTFNTALFHAYYLIMLGPPLAALVGVTVWALARLWRRRPWLTWALVAVLIVITVVFQIITLGLYPEYARTITAVAIIAGLGGLGLLAWRQRRWAVRVAVVLLVLSLLWAPLTWSVLTALNPDPNVALPRAGPGEGNAARSWSGPLAPVQEQLADFLLAHTEADSYLFATLRATEASPYIVATGRPVLAVGGFSGSDDVAGVEELSAMVAAGELRYFLGNEWGQKHEIAAWLKSSCSVVALPGLSGPQVRSGVQQRGFVLYDCGGEIAATP